MRIWLAVCILGAATGLFLALIAASPNNSLVSGPLFVEILPHPFLYWPYPTFGLLIAALAFYVCRNGNKR